jgi:chromosome segregation ATPase
MAPKDQAELQRALGRLESAVAALTEEVRSANKQAAEHDASMDRRVGELERWKVYHVAFIAGVLAALGTLGTVVWRVLSLLKH